MQSINPATAAVVARHPIWSSHQLEAALTTTAAATPAWAATPIAERAALLSRLAARLRARRDALADLITLEMGKRRLEALAEVDKCAMAATTTPTTRQQCWPMR
jgi:acyl-CoA reductase-like NAD-dependent aldehyde dehydrogenase